MLFRSDTEHQFGHGKVENLSAFIETLLLLVTCIWIIYEASHRLITGRLHLEVNFWSYIVIITSIIVDISRSKALLIAAKKHKSQALEADALHFSTDVWSSLVVLAGLILANFGILAADSIAALIVALIVITIAVRLGKRSVDVLLDRAPENAAELISKIARNMK